MSIAFIIRDGTNTPRTVSALLMRDGSNVQQTVAAGFDRSVANVSELFFNPSGSLTLSVDAAPATVSGTTHGSGTVTTSTSTATVTGGTAPFTYAWNLVGYTSGTPPTATAPTNDVTAFTQTSLDPDTVETGTWTCTVTDSDGNTATSGEVTSIFIDNS